MCTQAQFVAIGELVAETKSLSCIALLAEAAKEFDVLLVLDDVSLRVPRQTMASLKPVHAMALR